MKCPAITLLATLAIVSAGAARADDSTAAAASPAANPTVPEATTAQVAEPAEPVQHCWKEYHVGSAMPVTHCDEGVPEHEKQRRVADWNKSLARANQVVHAPGGP